MTQFGSPFLAPATEATQFLTDRQVMPKPDFLDLTDEGRTRAFTIARQTETQILQDTMDAIRQHLQEGGTLWTFKEKFPEIVAPYREAGREWHLNLVVQQNTKQAMAVGAYAQRQRVKRAFPYVEYRTGPNPRPSHAALNGKIFAVDDPFLLSHTPPWDFGCNCDLVPRTAAQVGRVADDDASLPPDQHRVVDRSPALQRMLASNQLPDPERGGIHPVNVATPTERGGEYSFRPDRLNQDVDLSPYSPELRTRLSRQLEPLGYTISADGLTAIAGPFPQALKSARVAPATAPRVVAFKSFSNISPAAAIPRRVGKVARPVSRIARRAA